MTFEGIGFIKLISQRLFLGYLLVQVAIVMPGLFYRCVLIKHLINNGNTKDRLGYGGAPALTMCMASVICAILVQWQAWIRDQVFGERKKAFRVKSNLRCKFDPVLTSFSY